MEHPNHEDDALSAQNLLPYSEKQPFNQQPPPADGLVNSAMPTQYQPYYAPYSAVPNYGSVDQPPLPTTVVIPVQSTRQPDYLEYSLFTMLCCFLPLGIAALVYSKRSGEGGALEVAQEVSPLSVRSTNEKKATSFTQEANRMGNSAEAQQNSRKARILAHSALGVGIVLVNFIIICVYYYVLQRRV
ncbi:UNVERIFIED_CONTAM: hypothetical protein K2H54_039411 [Gekko kuhli]